MKPINKYAVTVALIGSAVLLSGCGGGSTSASSGTDGLTQPLIDTSLPTPDAIIGG